jgi:hypothetical protein
VAAGGTEEAIETDGSKGACSSASAAISCCSRAVRSAQRATSGKG